MKKNDFEPKPFLPCVTMEEISDFKPNKPETRTASPLINAVLEAINVVGPSSSARIARYLKLDSRKLASAVEILTGMTINDIRKIVLDDKLSYIECFHPEWSSEEIAKSLGYSSRSALFNSIGKELFDDQVGNMSREKRYAANRRGEKLKMVVKKKRW